MIRIPNSADIGATKELIVCIDLLKFGFEVFKAVSAGASFDLIATFGDRNFRIEVKSSRDHYRRFLTGSANLLAVPKEEGGVIYYRLPLQGFWETVTPMELIREVELEKRAKDELKLKEKNEAKV